MQKQVGIGLDLGGSSIKYALATRDGDILKQGHKLSDADLPKVDILANLNMAIQEMQAYARQNQLEISVVGVGTPGNVDLASGLLMGSTPNFKQWMDVNISQELGQLCDLPVFADNDANLMAYGESCFGAGKEYENMICVTVGTGIGGGFIINGEIYRGAFYAGAELGHTLVEAEGIACNCGSKGCLEMYASGSAIIRDFKLHAQKDKPDPQLNEINVAHIYELYHKNNPAARRAIDDAIYYLGRGLASAINVFNPEAIIIGGGVADAGDIYIDAVRQQAFKYAMPVPSRNVKIEKAKLGNKAGFLGAVAFAFNQWEE